ncbi:hypothetical protein [Streptomyces roseicoloratus]|uniref:hypothetical protein n=1 Tax=Streptomyces roseicoloratus TaxID=2508722 RepID=UPI001009F25F|nr:hypothetical protein [Streptomyces roseicoloratus]
MITTANVATLGGVAVGLGILTWVLIPWYRKSRDWKELVPFGSGLALGTLSVLAAGGVLGKIAGWILGATNKAGDYALSAGTGAQSPLVTRAGITALDPGGSVILLLFTVGLIAVWRSAKKKIRGSLATGVVCGCSIGLSAGVAGIAGATLVPLANSIGGVLTGFLGA